MEASQAERHISGVYTKLLMEFLVGTMPPDRIDTLLAQAAESRSLAELADAGSWSSYDQFRRLLEERSRLDPTSLYDQSELLSDWLKTWELSQAAQTLDSPGTLLASGSEENPLVPIRRYEKTEVASNEWTIRESFKDDYQPYPEFCDFAAVQYAIIPIVFGLPTGEVVEEECQCRGDAACVFRLRWQDEDTDSLRADHYRMRAELVEDRLEQIQEMIADLTSSERYEDVLQGFVASSLRTAVDRVGPCWLWSPGPDDPARCTSKDSTKPRPCRWPTISWPGERGPATSSPWTWPRPVGATASWPSTRAVASSPPCRSPPSSRTPVWRRRPSTPPTPSTRRASRPTRPRPCWIWPCP